MRLSLFSVDRTGFPAEPSGLPAKRNAMHTAVMAGLQNGIRTLLATMRQIGDAIAAGKTFDPDQAKAVRERHGQHF